MELVDINERIEQLRVEIKELEDDFNSEVFRSIMSSIRLQRKIIDKKEELDKILKEVK